MLALLRLPANPELLTMMFRLVALATLVTLTDAHSEGVGSCAAGFDKFPTGTEHNGDKSTRPGGDNFGDLAASGMTLTLGDTQLDRPTGGTSFHFTGECTADYLCGKCQGNCADDTACAEGLVCLSRDANEDVPGCSGTIGLWDGMNYCYDPSEDVARDGGDGRRELQGQEATVDTPVFKVGTPYTLKLEAPDTNLFKGYLFRVEGEDGQDMSGAIETVSENMQVLPSTGQMDDVEGATLPIMTTCAMNVAAVCHTEAEDKSMVEATITFPQPGLVNLEVTVMVGEHQWYLTNYVLTLEEEVVPTESPPPTVMAEDPTESPPPTMKVGEPTESPPTDMGEDEPTEAPPPAPTSDGMKLASLPRFFVPIILFGVGLAFFE